ncbi:MAG: amidohydrolase [Alphaproteobacteria bacterium]|nr:amidohydrolase [Alphaproteobacteria bacterium]MCB9696761.1 amidohydrolase [Alphaproteobacteria bacterium]
MDFPPDLFARIVALRRDLHRRPELGFGEHDTMARISAELTALGLPHRTGVAGTGIVADLPGLSPGPRIALRADTDALPIQEQTGLPFASTVPGVMHACGHDGHSSALVGAAGLLVAAPPPHPVRLIWQPAEELGTGAPAMIEAGVLDGVDAIFGGHLDRTFEPGTLVVTDGPVNASTDTFHVELIGRQGHGARPHETIDAIVIGSLVVNALQTVVSRHVDPAQAAVVTVGRFDAGTAPNVIAGKAILEGTIRAQRPDVRARLKDSVRRVVQTVGALHGARAEFQMIDGTPPLVNPPFHTALAREAAVEVVGAEHVAVLRTANMGGEDFAWYLERVPGAYIRFGGMTPGENAPAHSGRFDFHEDALAYAARWYDRIARMGARLG